MIAYNDPLLQSWLEVYRALEALESRPVTLNNFRSVHAEAAWHYAVNARGPDAERTQHKGPSPWLAFAKNQPADQVRLLLPLWIAYRRLRATPLPELAEVMERDPMLARRAQIGVTLMAHAVAHPVDWRWLRQLFEQLHPRPLLRGDDDVDDDMDEDGDDHGGDHGAMGGPRTRTCRRAPTPPEPVSPAAPAPAVPPGPSTRPILGWRRPVP